MEFLLTLLDYFRHLDDKLMELVNAYGAWTYSILFGIIFLETGVVVTPFLPGDSLLFASGVIAGYGALSPHLLFVLLTIAGVLGDSVNYAIGKYVGPRVLRSETSRWFNRKHLDRTHAFFEKYGGKTIIIARFVPIVRTFAPFVAGIGAMTYTKFFAYNVIGAALWVSICVYAGYFFGQFEVVKKNFELVVLAIIFVSLLPVIVEFLRARYLARRSLATPTPARTAE